MAYLFMYWFLVIFLLKNCIVILVLRIYLNLNNCFNNLYSIIIYLILLNKLTIVSADQIKVKTNGKVTCLISREHIHTDKTHTSNA